MTIFKISLSEGTHSIKYVCRHVEGGGFVDKLGGLLEKSEAGAYYIREVRGMEYAPRGGAMLKNGRQQLLT